MSADDPKPEAVQKPEITPDPLDLARIVMELGETKLQAQMALALGADSRAMTFAGILSPSGAAVVAYGIVSLRSAQVDTAVAWGAIVTGAALLVAAMMASRSARPVLFATPGNRPDNWWSHGVEGRDLAVSIRNQSNFYDDGIVQNRETLLASSEWMQRALGLAVFSPVLGLITFAAVALGVFG